VKVGDVFAITDATGHFTIDKVKTGTENVTVQAQGFGPYTASLKVNRGTNHLNVVLVDGHVSGTIRENAVVRETITNLRITVGGVHASIGSGGHFEATEVPVGQDTVLATSPGHEVYRRTLTVTPGDNSLVIALNLTPVETYTRLLLAFQFARYREAYRFVHPDVAKHYPFGKFEKDFSYATIVSFRIIGSRRQASWKPPYLPRTYRDIVVIDRTEVEQDQWGTYTDNYSQHWAQIGGRWYIFYDWRPQATPEGETSWRRVSRLWLPTSTAQRALPPAGPSSPRDAGSASPSRSVTAWPLRRSPRTSSRTSSRRCSTGRSPT
jgi:hypothetical protein